MSIKVLKTILLKYIKKNLLIYAKSLKSSIQLKSLVDNSNNIVITISEEILIASVTTQLLSLNKATYSITSVLLCPCLTYIQALLSSTMVTHKNTTGSWLLGFTVFCCVFLDFTVKYWQLWLPVVYCFFFIYCVFLLKLCLLISFHLTHLTPLIPQQNPWF